MSAGKVLKWSSNWTKKTHTGKKVDIEMVLRVAKVFLVSYLSIMRYFLFFASFYFAPPWTWLVLTHGLFFLSSPSTAISLYIDFTIIDKIDR